jgi:hypothetical protein
MFTTSKANYRFSTIPMKILMAFITELNKSNHLEAQETQNNKSNLEQKEQIKRHHNTSFQTYYRTIPSKTA